MKMKPIFYYLFLIFCIILALALESYLTHAIDVKPGERLNLNMVNVTNVTYPCIILSNDSVYLSASIALGDYACNITGMGIEEIITIYTSGGGSSGGRYVKKVNIATKNTTLNIGSVESKKPYWANLVQDKPKEAIQATATPTEEPKPIEPVKNETVIQETKKESFNWIPLIILIGVMVIILIIVIIGYASSENR